MEVHLRIFHRYLFAIFAAVSFYAFSDDNPRDDVSRETLLNLKNLSTIPSGMMQTLPALYVHIENDTKSAMTQIKMCLSHKGIRVKTFTYFPTPLPIFSRF